MENNNASTGLDYRNAGIPGLFFKLFFPTLLGMVFNALITIIDGIFVGRSVGPDGIASVNIIAPLYMVTTGIGLMFGIGASVLAGIALSRRDIARTNSIVSSAFIFATLLMAVFIALLFIFDEEVARFLGSSDRLLPYATTYLVWIALGLIPTMWDSIGMMVIRLDGSPKYAMSCNIVPAVLNIILDWWFIFPLGMGVKGAALATAISCGVGGTMALCYFRWSYIIRFTLRISGFWRSVWRQIRIGSSAFITEIAMSVMMFTGNYVFMSFYGESGVAAYSIACYLFPLIFMINNAVAQSAQPIISFNYGTGDMNRVRRALKVSLTVAVVCGCLATLGIGLLARPIVSLFISPDCEAGRIAVDGLPVFSLTGVFFALNIAFIGFYQSIEKAIPALLLTLLRGVALLVPMFLLLPHLLPMYGIWGAIPASEFITLIVVLATFRRINPYMRRSAQQVSRQ